MVGFSAPLALDASASSAEPHAPARTRRRSHGIAGAAARHFPNFSPDLVVSIPPKLGQTDRFGDVRAEIAQRIPTAACASALRQIRVVEGYRQMARAQRALAARGCFSATYPLHGRSVLLIDDVVTSGGQAHDAIRALKAAGAADVRFVAVARAAGTRTGYGAM